jgi:(1->4)-alpha-D-glucan 1-alpha-D-glucosylmutase
MGLIDAALTGNRATSFLGAFLPFARRLAALGAHNSLVQSVLALTCPGVPDLYNGMELWDFSLVDPDNRAPVDYAVREQLLAECQAALRQDRAGNLARWFEAWHDGRIKLAVTLTLLQARAARSELFTTGDYQPLSVTGAQADEVCAFARTRGEQVLVCAVARFPHRRERQGVDTDTRLALPPTFAPATWHELLSGRELKGSAEGIALTELFATLPVAVLVASAARS